MTDPRPSENTESIPQWPGFRAAGFFDDLPKADAFFTEPAAEAQDPIEELIESAQNAHDPGLGLVFAQLATVKAIQAQTEQLRIANKLRLAQIEQLGEIAKTQTMPDYPFDPAVNVYHYLSLDERKGLGL